MGNSPLKAGNQLWVAYHALCSVLVNVSVAAEIGVIPEFEYSSS